MVERRNTSMPLKPHELDKIATVTLAHYEQHAEEFRAGTRDHDVSQNIASLLRHIEGESPFTILDFGCGPGRDLKTFSGLGTLPSDWRTPCWRYSSRRFSTPPQAYPPQPRQPPILDGRSLESDACGCYAAAKEAYARLLH
jgi:hypothetical protein